MTQNWLVEELKTIRNLCDISLILIKEEKDELLPTALELLYHESQNVVDENCVVKE